MLRNPAVLHSLRKPLSTIVLALTLSACQSTSNDSNENFSQLAEQVMDFRAQQDEESLTNINAEYLLSNLTPEHLAAVNQQRVRFLAQLDNIGQSQLSEENKINFAILRAQIQNEVDLFRFKDHYVPLSSEYGFHSELQFMIQSQDYSTKLGYQLFIMRMKQLPRFFDQNIYWMKQGLSIGLTQPKVVLKGFEDSIMAFVAQGDDVEKSPFFAPFLNNQANLPEQEFLALQREAKRVIEAYVNPAYLKYNDFFVNEYRPNARENIAWSSVPDGKAFYVNRAKHFTTTQMTPKEIHELGLREVARIRSEMNRIIEQVGFEGSFAEFIHFLRTDPQFYAKTPIELLKEASFIAKKMDAKLPQLFHTLPRLPYGVAPVPDSIAPKFTTGRYLGPSKETDAGYYWVNTYALDKRPLYVLEALTLHEGVPGHHLQISLNAELTHLPAYRQSEYISAFGEGWGLYAEYLGIEAGFYQDPYSDFGRLTYEMWRAARLVVDTGVHMFGWTREQVMQFMQDNTALSLHNVKTETDRYISWPGQALSYKVGELTIKRLRAKAEAELGEAFDVREFHHQVLKHGSVPLFVLEAQIDKYIAQTLQSQ
ncbi:DUF885 domain-containing protein [Pseudoalteromonas luteoviolacea]|uniref:DUF885 domain-containing protein n=1 Tax=Pseudoalteromonas luteoviolacea TaxID=43657 RepID=UPI0007B05603|nr:DUF885 domain-containing protein [Pseudoalteromonas luteoviolacea]